MELPNLLFPGIENTAMVHFILNILVFKHYSRLFIIVTELSKSMICLYHWMDEHQKKDYAHN